VEDVWTEKSKACSSILSTWDTDFETTATTTEPTEEPHFDKGDDERLLAQDTDSSSDDFCESCVELGF
jgi:hypothetical protein